MNRRKFLTGLGAAVGTFAAEKYVTDRAHRRVREQAIPAHESQLQSPEHESETQEMQEEKYFLDIEPEPREYKMGKLAGTRFSGLLSDYTIGEERVVKSEEEIDFTYRQAELWKQKLAWVKDKAPDKYPRVEEAARTLFATYDQKHSKKISLLGYRALAQNAIDEVRHDLPLSHITHLVAFHSLEKRQVELLEHFEHEIHAEDLLAYALTELMPTAGDNADVGAQTLDFLLRNAGMEFVDRIPAEFDSRISIGPYQFTSDALYEKGNEHHGASLIQLLMKTRHIPANVLQLHGEQNHKAAYLFAIYNLAFLVQHLGAHRSRELLRLRHELPRHLVTQYIATAHHRPANAIQAFGDYAEQLLKHHHRHREHHEHHHHRRHEEKEPEPSFVSCCEVNDIGIYCQKTLDNIAALSDVFSKTHSRA